MLKGNAWSECTVRISRIAEHSSAFIGSCTFNVFRRDTGIGKHSKLSALEERMLNREEDKLSTDSRSVGHALCVSHALFCMKTDCIRHLWRMQIMIPDDYFLLFNLPVGTCNRLEQIKPSSQFIIH